MNSPYIFAISGEKNSGKTTLIEAMLPIFKENGLRTAVIKHDGHSFEPDVPGTDTYRFLNSGACGTAVFDSAKFMLVKYCSISEKELLAAFPDADLILIEGLKNSDYPKIFLKSGEWRDPRKTADEILELMRRGETK